MLLPDSRILPGGCSSPFVERGLNLGSLTFVDSEFHGPKLTPLRGVAGKARPRHSYACAYDNAEGKERPLGLVKPSPRTRISPRDRRERLEKFIRENPTAGIEFFPVEKRLKYVPPAEDVRRLIWTADKDDRDYLIVIAETMARVGEIDRLTWDDVDLRDRTITLYTRKKRGGHLTPRKVPMTELLIEPCTDASSKERRASPGSFCIGTRTDKRV